MDMSLLNANKVSVLLLTLCLYTLKRSEMTLNDDESARIRNYHHRRGPRPSIDAAGYLMPLPSSRPPSRRGSLQKIEINPAPAQKAPPQKSYSVTDIHKNRGEKLKKVSTSLDSTFPGGTNEASGEEATKSLLL